MPEDAPAPASLGGWREVGVVHGTGLVLETADGLCLVDAHVLLAEEVFQALRAHALPLPGIALLFPMPVRLDGDLGDTETLRASLASLGFGWQAWREGDSGGEVALSALPAVVAEADPKPVLLDVVAAIRRAHAESVNPEGANPTGDHPREAREAALRVLACHATDDASARLPEVREVLARVPLDESPQALPDVSCSHGHPLRRFLPWRVSTP